MQLLTGQFPVAVLADKSPPTAKVITLLRFLVFTASLSACFFVVTGRAENTGPLFESEIAPILAEKCGNCHSDDVRKAGLDLSSISGIRRGGESGEPLIDESVEESWLWIVLDGGEMPPPDATPLSDEELALIRAWIEGGGQSESPTVPETSQLTQHDVLPILLLRCAACHGPRLQQGGLALHRSEAILAGGQSGPAVVPGKPDSSRMIERIETQACPPRDQLLKFFVERPPASEVETLRQWITAGAPIEEVAADVATTDPDPLVSDEDREHWAFQPPSVANRKASLDTFVLKKLQKHELDFAPEADRDTLIRRAYLDLIGMPPTLEEWRTWRRSDDGDWYARMIDHLLASPHYGERWGRYWLDLAGYADSEGGVSADPIREVAWKYRDYVIESFNEDKPYDRFLLEQIAGDELVDYENAETITEQMVENLIATGFLRMGIDQTGSRTMNFVPERLGVIDDALAVVSSSVMGMTMECARCHSHKYDPIPHRDYYRFKAIFQGALDEHDWLTFRNRFLEVATPQRQSQVEKVNPPLSRELRSLERQLREALAEKQRATLRHYYPQQSDADRDATLVALKKADNQRTLTQRRLVEKLQRAELKAEADPPPPVVEIAETIERVKDRIAEVRWQMEPSLKIRALWDRGEPSPTYILYRGEHNKPGPLVGPGVPSVLTDGRTPFNVEPPFPNAGIKTGRRLAFARWLTEPQHPLTARVMANRIWYHHFGSGLVKTLENFGVQGAAPSHPELLDWLALEFIERGWSIKEMHRLIMNSRTYRQSSRVTDERRRRDPDGSLLSRMPLRRMNAEAVRDSLLRVAGMLDQTAGGPPDAVSVDRDGLVTVNPRRGGGWRRSVYAQYRRTEIPTMMATFDYPEMGPNCISRTVSIVSPQSLMLMNNGRVRELAAAFARRVKNRLGETASADELGAQVEMVYHLALSRPPTDEERELGIDALQEMAEAWDGKGGAALETYCHTVLNSAAFLYID